MSLKQQLEEKERAVRRLLAEVISSLNSISEKDVQEVARFVQAKLEVYERDLEKHSNGTTKREL